jgi:hypothetical protein
VKRGEKLTDDRIEAIVAQEIASSQTYDSSELSTLRMEAIEYLDGVMTKWPSEKGRSSVVDMTTLDTMSWILPSLLRLFSASDRMAIAEPTAREHEAWAEQATTGINHTFWKENAGYLLLYAATFDSLLHGDGIVKHWWDDTPKTAVSFHSGLTDEAYADLLEPEDTGVDEDGKPKEEIEVLSHELCEYTLEPGDEGYVDPAPMLPPPGMMGVPGMPPMPPQPQMMPDQMQAEMPGMEPPEAMEGPPQKAMLHEAKIKRTTRFGRVRMQSVAPEDFIISADATTLRTARMIGDKGQYTRSALLEMGFDYEKVMGVSPTQDDDPTEVSRRDDATDHSSDQPLDNTAMEQVTLFNLYLKIDVDGDGIAETIQIFFTGYGNVGTLLEWQIWEDEPVYSNVPCYPVPHRWNANGIFKRTRDVQEIKTALVRGALDSIYGSINPQRVVRGRCLNPDELTNPSFGGAIMMEESGNVENLALEFTGEVALKGIEYFDQVMERRTGVSRTTMALDPEALQNTTATASQLSHDAAYSQIELIACNQAELGWKTVFEAILKLMVRHQRRKSTVRLTNKKWADIDPRHWDADMDITINTGLGSGSRDRDIAVLSSIQSNQVAVASILREAKMPGKALEMVPMIIDTVKKSGEAAGVRQIDDFFPEVSDQDLQGAAEEIQKANSAPPPEAQAEQAKLQAQQANDQAKLQMQQAEHGAQMQADATKFQMQTVTDRLKSKNDLEAKQQQMANDLVLQREKMMLDAQIKREQLAAEMELKREQMAAEIALKRELAQQQMQVDRENARTASAEQTTKPDGEVSNSVHFGGEPG